jgi:hypothetical protein
LAASPLHGRETDHAAALGSSRRMTTPRYKFTPIRPISLKAAPNLLANHHTAGIVEAARFASWPTVAKHPPLRAAFRIVMARDLSFAVRGDRTWDPPPTS